MKPPSPNRSNDPKPHWHRWFAWYPVHLRTESRWLTYVERRWDSGEKTGDAIDTPDPAPDAKHQTSEHLKLKILADIVSRRKR